MPKKSYGKRSRTCRVTFELPPTVAASSAAIVGDFNYWSPDTTPMIRRKDGRFSVTLSLDADHQYRYRFLLDGKHWENDWEADSYEPNDHGSEDSVVQV